MIAERLKYFRFFGFSIIMIALCGNVLGNSFAGHVYDSETGLVLPGAKITIGNNYLVSALVAFTDSCGLYDVRELAEADDYTVMASAPGFASLAFVMESTPGTIDFSLTRPDSGYLVETINQGLKKYQFNGEYYYRTDGTVVASEGFFPNIDDAHPLIDSLLSELECSPDTSSVDLQIWKKCKAIWLWLAAHAVYNPSDPNVQAATEFMMNYCDGWPSIEAMAVTYDIYGFIPWGTCMSRAQILTTLLYRAGITKDNLAIAETRWMLRYSQHMYAIVRLADRWIYLDPIYIYETIPEYADFHSIPPDGSGDNDYCHPYNIDIIPGSNLGQVPEISNRRVNYKDIYITSPPTLAHYYDKDIMIAGLVRNPMITGVSINGDSYPVIDGSFEAELPVIAGNNPIVAVISDKKADYSDSILVIRENMLNADQDADGVCDWEDNCPLVFNPSQSDLDQDGTGDACDMLCGDANSDQSINISDAVFIINYVFAGGNPPNPIESGDANCDAGINISDAVWIINYIFVSGNVPGDMDGDGIPDC